VYVYRACSCGWAWHWGIMKRALKSKGFWLQSLNKLSQRTVKTAFYVVHRLHFLDKNDTIISIILYDKLDYILLIFLRMYTFVNVSYGNHFYILIS